MRKRRRGVSIQELGVQLFLPCPLEFLVRGILYEKYSQHSLVGNLSSAQRKVEVACGNDQKEAAPDSS
jgi:hypothetical protein